MKDLINNFESEPNPAEKKLYLRWRSEKPLPFPHFLYDF